jgi:branched-chain amino acid transport system permease protein
MNFDIALFLGQDGLVNGAIYGLLAIGLVLVFTVTRVIFISQGDLVAYSALSMASLEASKTPMTFWLLISLSFIALCLEMLRWRRGEQSDWRLTLVWTIVCPLIASLLLFAFNSTHLIYRIIVTLVIVIPLGPLLYRMVFRPIQNASVLFLLITAVTLHGVMVGLGLIFFGAEGWRITAFTEMNFVFSNVNIKGQSIIIILVTISFVSLLFLFFEKLYLGKVLRATAVNRIGAQLVGIPIEFCGDLSFAMAALIACVSGILIAPVQTIYYDTGFLIGLKGFVAAIIGGLANFPLALIGALIVGQLEAFSSYWASAYKEVIVFTLIIPVLFWRSKGSRHIEENE